MRIIAKKALKEFWKNYPNAEQSLRAWHAKTKQADWKSTSDVKNDYRNASFVADNRVVFNIKGNQYRLVAAINYQYQIVYIRFIGTHNKYDSIDVTTI
ncbi:MAG: type II toxin-antitoxin system HigB family toxin [Deltaproteobacteria bacterium]|nr:type II toxin-antitoxin system HigB family toxin [Deltaproteobacteria bacterium]